MAPWVIIRHNASLSHDKSMSTHMNFCKVHVNLAPRLNRGPAQLRNTFPNKALIPPIPSSLEIIPTAIFDWSTDVSHGVRASQHADKKCCGMGLQAMKKWFPEDMNITLIV